MSTSLGHCTFKATNHNKIQLVVQGRSSFPYPSRCSFARPTLVAAKKKRTAPLSLGNQRSAYAVFAIGDSDARPADCKRHAFGFESKFEYIHHMPDARPVLDPPIQTDRSNEAKERFMCDNNAMNASRILRSIRSAQLTTIPTRVITTLSAFRFLCITAPKQQSLFF